MSNIKAVLFDADGVLVNGKLFSQQYFEDFGVKIPDEFFTGEFEEALVGKKDLKEILQTKLKDWKWDKSVEELIDYWLHGEQIVDAELIKIVKQLKQKDIKCYVVTNQEKYRAQHLAEELGFGNLFDGFFASTHVGHKKPDLKFFQRVLSKIGLIGEQVVYFDDSPGYLEGAKSLGIQAFLYQDIPQVKQVLKVYNLER